MSKIDLTSLSLEEATLKVGLMKAGSVLHEKGELARKIAQRMPMTLGMILLQAETEKGATEEEMHEIMTVIADMIERNRIDKDYIKARFSAVSERLSVSGWNVGMVEAKEKNHQEVGHDKDRIRLLG